MTVYERLGVTPVVNAAGRLTALGGAVLDRAVIGAMAEAAGVHVDLAELKQAAGRYCAARCGADAGYVTGGAAAGVVLMTAAVVTRGDAAAIADLPASTPPNRILVQQGHLVDFGAPIAQMVRIGGGVVVPVGATNLTSGAELRARLHEPDVSGILYVQSHHAAQKGTVTLPEVVELARGAGVPVLVDAAAEEDLTRFTRLGADLVAYSGGKALEGPTSGFVVGRRDLIEACAAQESGVGRAMKVGKEAIAGLIAALERYGAGEAAGIAARRHAITDALRTELEGVEGVAVSEEADEAGRDIVRLRLSVTPAAGMDLPSLVRELRGGTPPIAVRTHHLGEGWVTLDPRPLEPAQVGVIGARIRQILGTGTQGRDN